VLRIGGGPLRRQAASHELGLAVPVEVTGGDRDEAIDRVCKIGGPQLGAVAPGDGPHDALDLGTSPPVDADAVEDDRRGLERLARGAVERDDDGGHEHICVLRERFMSTAAQTSRSPSRNVSE
jgi:hypothetical protein